MTKFNKGDVIRCAHQDVTGTYIGTDQFGDHLVTREDGAGWTLREDEANDPRYLGAPVGGRYWWLFKKYDIELVKAVEPAEHPALTLAKAEVSRLTAMGYPGRDVADDGKLEAFEQILAAFGLVYRQKPVVVEFEFVAVGS